MKPLFTTNRLPREEPVRYRGPLPSLDCQAYVHALNAAHDEWVERRLALGMTEEAPVAPKPAKRRR